METFFSPDYATARGRFVDAARAAGAALATLDLDGRGPAGGPLTIDIAWLGAPEAERLVLHTSGMHGVEAFAGSAIQLAALPALARPPAGCAVALVHVLNPWGMAWLRRVNAHNVDLNRNFLLPGDERPAAPGLYDRIDGALNPASPPGSDRFLPVAAGLVLRHGLRALRQAIAEGQYRYPLGLFYGGAALEPEPRRFIEWLVARCAGARYVCALDIHTGLGAWGGQTLFREPGVGVTPAATLGPALGGELLDPAADKNSYTARGSMGQCLPRVLAAARVDFVLQEVGTYPAFKVLRALRAENRWHHHGGGTLDHPAKRALLEVLCPAPPAWRQRAVQLGMRLLKAACEWTFEKYREP